jgi:hypothetical protein
MRQKNSRQPRRANPSPPPDKQPISHPISLRFFLELGEAKRQFLHRALLAERQAAMEQCHQLSPRTDWDSLARAQGMVQAIDLILDPEWNDMKISEWAKVNK